MSHLQRMDNDDKLLSILSNKYKDLVMNDKEKLNSQNFAYFIPYLQSSDGATFKNTILPEFEFMMNRNGSMIPLICQSVN